MLWSEFNALESAAIGDIVRERGQKVGVFWLNGTRRWFELERRAQIKATAPEELSALYASATAEQIARILDLFYSHGMHTMIMPAITVGNLVRGNAYIEELFFPLIEHMVTCPAFLEALNRWGVRARAFGEMRSLLTPAQAEWFDDMVRPVEEATARHSEARLFLGFCATDAANAALIAHDRLREAGRHAPFQRSDLVEAYYGANIDRVHLSIAHGRMSAHSTPFMMNGEHLYFMMSPSFYLDQYGLREVLYDHLFARKIDDVDYAEMDDGAWDSLQDFYRSHAHKILGVGLQGGGGKLWTPSWRGELDDRDVREIREWAGA